MSSSGSTQSAGPHPAHLVPGLIYLYPLIAGWLATSEQPRVLGRWSMSFFAYNVWGVAIIALLVLGWRARRHDLVAVAQLFLALTTFLLPVNNQLRELPWIAFLLPTVRLTCGLALLLGAFETRHRLRRRDRLLAMAGGILSAVSLVDYVLPALAPTALASATPQHQEEHGRMRVEFATEQITSKDMVIVGDSVVWGQGVEIEQRFGDRLQSRLEQSGLNSRVYSLGELGAGPTQYGQMLDRIPSSIRADRVIVAYYMNDMPGPRSLRVKIKSLTRSLGPGSPSLRFGLDRMARVLTADVDQYHAWIGDCYREDEPTFEERWALLERQMQTVAEAAASRSIRRPILMILPILVEFGDYPLDDAHRRVAELGESLGFEVLDLLKRFRDDIGDGVVFRVSPDDNHFNGVVHDLVAQALSDRLIAVESAPSGLP